MKQTACAVLMTVVLATPVFAANVYLKEGGYIQAKRVWKSEGRVNVLANRDTLTSFEFSEVNMKRTFARRPKAVKKIDSAAQKAKPVVQNPAAVSQRPEEKKAGISLPNIPKLPSISNLPEKTPDSLLPSGGSGNKLQQHNKNMAEKAGV